MPYNYAQKGLDETQEVISKRDWNKKVFDIGGGKLKYICHARHLHYKDNGEFKDIDHRLTFDNNEKKFKHNKASYHCAIPEYADELIDFTNMWNDAGQLIKFKLNAQHIKGVYVEDAEGSTYVNYPDAFGDGIDLRVYSYWRGIKKVVVFNKAPAIIPALETEIILPKNGGKINVDGDVADLAVAHLKAGLGGKIKPITKNARAKRLWIGDAKGNFTVLNSVNYKDGSNKIGVVKTNLVNDNGKIKQVNDVSDLPFTGATYPLIVEL